MVVRKEKNVTERKNREEELRESNERLKGFMDSATDAFVLFDSNLNLVEANKRALQMMGLSEGDVIGKNIKEIAPDIAESGRYEKYIKVIETGKTFFIDDFIPDPKYGDLHVSVKAFKVGDGLGLIFTDITERKKAEEASLKSEERYKALYDRAPVAMFKASIRDGKALAVNDVGISLFGYSSKKEFLSEFKVSEHWVDPDERKRLLDKLQVEGQVLNFQTRLSRKDGTPIWVEISAKMFPQEGYLEGAAIDITERKKAEVALRESEEKFRTLAEQSPNMIFINKKRRIVYTNKKCKEIMGYTQEEFCSEDFDFMKLIAPESRNQVKKNFRRHMMGEEIPPYEYKVLTKDGREIIAIHTTKLIDFEGERAILGILTDITEHKRIEEEMKRRLMKFRLEDGNLYLVKERSLILSIEAFNDILKIGYSGYVISRSLKEIFEKTVKGDFNFLWLAGKKAKETIPPDLKEIETFLESLSKKSGVLIEGVDYLISKNGFKKTLGFVQQIRETAYFKSLIVIVSIDPSTLNKRELRLLEKETSTIQPRQQTVKLSEDLLEILGFIYNRNQMGVKPSYTEICLGVGISKPTGRKKIIQLKDIGFVTSSINGRKKVVELTSRGRDIFLK